MMQTVTTAALKKQRATVEQQELTLNISLPKSLHNLTRENRSLITRLFS